ncbi:hypothetical protein [Aquabacterium sp.]|uniref:hypothetical protein n=1 Tax=Aquabacterium sp. TaxID=1872578 RepID=UPI004037FA86
MKTKDVARSTVSNRPAISTKEAAAYPHAPSKVEPNQEQGITFRAAKPNPAEMMNASSNDAKATEITCAELAFIGWHLGGEVSLDVWTDARLQRHWPAVLHAQTIRWQWFSSTN